MLVRSARGLVAACLLTLAVGGSVSCTRHVDFKQALQVTDVSGGWYDYGIVDGKNKLVPSVSFRIRKQPGTSLRSLSLNVHFKKIIGADRKEEQEFDEVFLQTVEFSEGDQTPLLTVRPETGYTGDPPQTRTQMLEHSQFQDLRARVFAKESSTTWVDLVQYDIPRVLISK